MTNAGDQVTDAVEPKQPPISAVRVDPRRKREEAQQKAPPAGGIDIQQVTMDANPPLESTEKNLVFVFCLVYRSCRRVRGIVNWAARTK